MANQYFNIHNGIKIGGLSIDAANGNITTTGTIVSTGTIPASFAGNVYILGNILTSGTGQFNGTLTAVSVSAGTIGNIGAAVVGSSVNSGTGQFNGTLTAVSVSAGTIGNASATLTGSLSTAAQTNITSVGTLTGLTMSGAIVPNGNNTVALGSASAYWSTVYGVSFVGTSTTAKYADLAECYTSDAEYEPGTVLDFGGDCEVTISSTDASTTVAGVVSTNPAYLMNSGLENVTQVQLALTGRVPCKVTGAVRQGQMMVSNGDGTARVETNPVLGSVIGKALENFDGDIGIIEVVVGRL